LEHDGRVFAREGISASNTADSGFALIQLTKPVQTTKGHVHSSTIHSGGGHDVERAYVPSESSGVRLLFIASAVAAAEETEGT